MCAERVAIMVMITSRSSSESRVDDAQLSSLPLALLTSKIKTCFKFFVAWFHWRKPQLGLENKLFCTVLTAFERKALSRRPTGRRRLGGRLPCCPGARGEEDKDEEFEEVSALKRTRALEWTDRGVRMMRSYTFGWFFEGGAFMNW